MTEETGPLDSTENEGIRVNPNLLSVKGTNFLSIASIYEENPINPARQLRVGDYLDNVDRIEMGTFSDDERIHLTVIVEHDDEETYVEALDEKNILIEKEVGITLDRDLAEQLGSTIVDSVDGAESEFSHVEIDVPRRDGDSE